MLGKISRSLQSVITQTNKQTNTVVTHISGPAATTEQDVKGRRDNLIHIALLIGNTLLCFFFIYMAKEIDELFSFMFVN